MDHELTGVDEMQKMRLVEKCACDGVCNCETVHQATCAADNVDDAFNSLHESQDVEVLAQLGEGAMGTVFKVLYKPLNQIMALKVLRSELINDRISVKRFEEEKRSASSLTHANLAAVYDCNAGDLQRPHILMEYYDGQTLQSFLRKDGYIDSARAVNLFLEVTEALVHAHMKGVLHRDLKPSNIMLLERDGVETVRLLDFGIAKVLSAPDDQAMTKTGVVVGSPLYMSPEQGMGLKVDVRSDVYSLGCVMYEALVGKPPFSAETPVATIFEHVQKAPPSFTEVFANHGISEQLESIVMMCLEKNPAARYQTVANLREDLLLLRNNRQLKWASVGGRRKQPPRPLFGIAVAVIVLGLLPLLYVCTRWSEPVPTSRVSAPPLADTRDVVDLSPYRSRLSLAVDYRNQKQLDKGINELTEVIKLDPKYAHAYNLRALLLDEKGAIPLAIKDYSSAIMLDPANSTFYEGRAGALMSVKEYTSAIEDLQKALSLNPESAAAKELMQACENCIQSNAKLEEATKNATPAQLESLKMFTGGSVIMDLSRKTDGK